MHWIILAICLWLIPKVALGQSAEMSATKASAPEQTTPVSKPLEMPRIPRSIPQQNVGTMSLHWFTSVLNHRKLQESMRQGADAVVEHRDHLQLASFQSPGDLNRLGTATTQFTKGGLAAAGDIFVQNHEELKRLTQGLRMNFDLAFWSSTSSTPALSHPAAIRYGLVLDHVDVVAENEEADLSTHYQTRTKWHIAPLVDEQTSYRVDVNPEAPADQWAPSTRFQARLIPSSPLTDDMAAVGQRHSLFDARLVQEQEYYELSVPVVPRVLSQQMTHTLRLPLYGQLRCVERLDREFHLLETQMNRLLWYRGAPEWNVSYFHQEQRFGSELAYYQARSSFTLSQRLPSQALTDSGGNLPVIRKIETQIAYKMAL